MMPLLVRRFERLGDLLRDGQRFVDRDRASRDALRQDPRPRRVPSRARVTPSALFEPVDRRDVRMVQRGEDLGFAREPRQPIGVVRERRGRILIAT